MGVSVQPIGMILSDFSISSSFSMTEPESEDDEAFIRKYNVRLPFFPLDNY
jgi:hypothetical protein